MATAKKQFILNVSLILSLAKIALELDEDLYFAKVANSRLKEKRYSHDEVWSKKK